MSGKVTMDSEMEYRREGVNMGLPSLSEYEIWRTDEEAVRRARQVLDGFCIIKKTGKNKGAYGAAENDV